MNWGGLKSIKLPNKVTSIGEKSFYNCVHLESINIPNSLISVGKDAFTNCYDIKVYIDGFTIPAGWSKINFANEDANPASISGGLYNTENEHIENLIIPNGVETIGSYAFYNFSKTKSIIIPDSVTDIGKGAFYGCGSIYDNGYNEIERFVIGNNVTNIYQYNDDTNDRIETEAAFGKLGPVNFLIIGKNTPRIKHNHFNFNQSTPSIILINFSQYNYNEIGFDNGSTISNHNIHKPYAESFNDFMFDIDTVEDKNTIKYNLCGYMGNGINKLYLPSNYNGNTYEIGDYVFYNCNKLTSIAIPNSVTKIGQYAFYKCNDITRIISNITTDTLFKVEPSIFEGIDKNNCTLFVPTDGKKTYEETDGWKDFKNIVEIDKCGDNLYYYIDNNDTLIIFGDGAMYNYDNDKNYYYTWDNNMIKSIIIENGVTNIGSYAFEGCYNLTSVTIPNSVTSIGYSAFEGCSSLTSIDIPNSVTSIGDYAFYDCYDLTNVTIPDSVISIGADAFYDTAWYDKQNDDIVYAGKVLYTHNDSSIKNITIKNGILGISANAFNGYTNLEYITIPNSVINIGYDAFYDTAWYNKQNDGIVYAGKVLYKYKGEIPIDTPIEIKKETIYITPKAFEGCISLNSITIPDSVTSIGDAAFYGCSGLTSVTIGNSVTSIGNSAFSGCSGLTSVTIPNNVTSIGNFAFENCINIEKVIIGKNVTNIGLYVFENCKKLKTVINLSSLIIEKEHLRNEGSDFVNMEIINAPNGSIEGDFIFGKNGRTNILCEYIGNSKNLTLPNDYKDDNYIIKASSFFNNNNLTNVIIPNSVTSIGSASFYDCSELTSVIIGNGVTHIGNFSFYDCYKINNLTIGNNVALIGDKAFAYCSGLTNVTIPNSVTSIGSQSFYNCSKITSVKIPNSVTSIGDNAFNGCSNLTSVEIGSCIKNIKNGTFRDCYNLKTLIIGDSVESIGEYAFEGCSSLEKIIIPDSVTSIGNYAFEGCKNIIEITIGKNVESIGDFAFKDCKGHKVINYSKLEIEKGVLNHGYVGTYASNITKI